MFKTTNEAWGFYGTAVSNYGLRRLDADQLFNKMVKRLMKQFMVEPGKAIQFLDSKWGRHLADSLGNFCECRNPTQAQLMMALEAYLEYNNYKNCAWIRKSMRELPMMEA